MHICIHDENIVDQLKKYLQFSSSLMAVIGYNLQNFTLKLIHT